MIKYRLQSRYEYISKFESESKHNKGQKKKKPTKNIKNIQADFLKTQTISLDQSSVLVTNLNFLL